MHTISYKFRIYPNKTQQVLMSKTFGCCRVVWNRFVEMFNNQDSTLISCKQFREEFKWMNEVSAAALQQKTRDFIQFKNQYFSKKRKNKLGRPNFKSKLDKQSYRLPNQKFKLLENTIKLEKIGLVKIVMDRSIPLDAKFISVTISRNKVGQYFASICTEHEIKQLPKTQKEIGIDAGIKHFIITSEGEFVENPRYFNKNQVKLKRLQRKHAKSKKGSNNRSKIQSRINRLYQKIINQKEHFSHNLSIDIVHQYDMIVIEGLDIAEMKENRKFSKEIHHVTWGKFFNQLIYKSKWYGKQLIQVDKYFPSSKTCSNCGNVKEELKISERLYDCDVCKFQINRDLNAAINLRNSVRVKAEQ